MQPMFKPAFQKKKGGPLLNLGGEKGTCSWPDIRVPTFPLNTPPPGVQGNPKCTVHGKSLKTVYLKLT